MIAFVILAAKRAGIGQRGGRDQPARVLAVLHALDQGRQQLVSRSVLHQTNQRLERAECQSIGTFVRQGDGSQPQILGQDRPDAGDQHAASDIREKLTTVVAFHDRSPLWHDRKTGEASTEHLAMSQSLDWTGVSSLTFNAGLLHDVLWWESRLRRSYQSLRERVRSTSPESPSRVPDTTAISIKVPRSP